ncbi:hypothetical protein [Croceitalea vernalis]|uniref:Uncharacterized protein n=1 Tax=Croceitalea vernalis TaxID=3075599 RepID=A0ABU3BHM0_9FLAO|nr:hypothetical protein [Croceitalea sp. P007]MDT0621644.1 hypothetical protein [Croceitalea sp. P007]
MNNKKNSFFKRFRICINFKFIFSFLSTLVLFSCDSESLEDNTIVDEVVDDVYSIYPISLAYKESPGETIVHYVGGELVSNSLEDFNSIFDGTDGLEIFNEETEVYCEGATVTFNTDDELTFEYNNLSFDYNYFFQNDTLKLNLNNQIVDLAIGDKQTLTIYGSLYHFITANESVGSSEAFLKFNFNDQFFFNAREDRYIPITNPQFMDPQDEATFFNKAYRLEEVD